MDPLNWILVTWLAVAGFIFFILQKFVEIWPPIEGHGHGIHSTSASSGSAVSAKAPVMHNKQKSQYQQQQNFSASSASKKVDARQSETANSTTSGHNRPQVSFYESQLSSGSSSAPSESVDWLNEYLSWFFSQCKQKPDFIALWLNAMNDAAKKVSPLVGCETYYEEVYAEDCSAPRFSRVRAEEGPRDHLTIRANVYSPGFKLKLVSSQRLPDRLLVTNYVAKLINLNGEIQVRSACIGNELLLMLCFNGRPDVTIQLENTDANREEHVDNSCVQEAIRKCLMSSVTNINLFGKEGQSSKVVDEAFKKLNAIAPTVNQVQSVQPSDHQLERFTSNRLLVKVLRAENLEEIDSFCQPYVVVELDEPPQKHTTTLGLNTSPTWDEHFLFDLDKRSEELLFEIYGKPAVYDSKHPEQQKFLGLAIISIEEIRHSSVTQHALKLNPRPYIKDKVKGSLFVECLSLYETTPYDKEAPFLIADADAIAALHKRSVNSDIAAKVSPAKGSSVLIKSVSEYASTAGATTGDSSSAQPITVTVTAGSTAPASSTAVTSQETPLKPPPRSKQSITAAVTPPLISKPRLSQSQTLDSRSADKRLERHSFFSGLKHKLSFRRAGNVPTRAQSLDQGQQALSPTDVTYHPPPRSISTPPNRNETRLSHGELGPGGSDSELSVTTSESVYHESSLVVEILENNVKKYYFIPVPMLRNPKAKKLMKSGKKLHIYKEHSFVAVKLPSSTTCKVCMKAVTTAFRKQGYQCRDCRLLCHKRCHFKVASSCPNSKVSSLQMSGLPSDKK